MKHSLGRVVARVVLLALPVALLALWGAGSTSAFCGIPGTYCDTAVGSFEIDGDTVASHLGEPVDWETVSTGTPPIIVQPFTDSTTKHDDSFGLGSKNLLPGGWSCVTGPVPAKDNIASGAVGFRVFNHKQFIYVNFTRVGVDGTANLDYEFNQSSAPNPACPALPMRTNGDIIIAFDASNGGSTITVNAYRWSFLSGSTTSGTLAQLPTGAKGVTFDGATNQSTSGGVRHTGNFGEAVLDLTDTIGNIACGEFNSVYMKSRSSTDINSALQDLVKPSRVPGVCPQSSLAKAVRNVTAGQTDFGPPPRTTTTANPGDTLEYQLTYTNSGGAPASNVIVSDPIPAGSIFVSCASSSSGAGCTPSPSASPTSVSWSLGSVAPATSITMTFRVKVNATFNSNKPTITNFGTVTTTEEGSKNSNTVTVSVAVAPQQSLTKLVRDDTTNPNGAFSPGPISASPGDIIEYQLAYANSGSGPATNVVVSDPIPSHSTFASCTSATGGGTNIACTQPTSGSANVSWSLGQVNPGVTYTMTFKVALDPVFPAGTTHVANTAVASSDQGPTSSQPVTVNVTAAPLLALVKSASTASAVPGAQITYTLTYSNTGNADATATVINENIPAGTQFVSCTGGCSPGSGASSPESWSIGTVKAGGSGSISLTVTVQNSVGCAIPNTATISSPDESGGASIPSNTLTIASTPGPNPAGANAHDSAFSAHVQAAALGIDQTLTPVKSSETGVGSDSHNASLTNQNIGNGTLQAVLLESSSASQISGSPAQADHVSVADAATVSVAANGVPVLTADAVRAVAHTLATGSSSSFDSSGSEITNLVVNGVGSVAVKPNETIPLPSLLFGAGASVTVDAETGSTSGPAAGQLSGGTYAADLTVTMLSVHIPNPPVGGAVDVTIGRTVAHSDFPQTRLCSSAPISAVSGHALIASETTTPPQVPIVAGFVSIPSSGGISQQSLASVLLGSTTEPTASAGNVTTASSGTPGSASSTPANTSTSTSSASAQNVCLLSSSGKCTIQATAVKSESNSSANGTTASSDDGGTQLVGLVVNGQSFATTPPPNTTIDLPNIGFVVLNEQFCENGSAASHTCTGTTHSGLTVRAIDVVITQGALGLAPGAEIVVAEAHSDAMFGG